MALELNGTTGVSLVQDGVVTAADLASTLDLSGKTVTLPSGVGGKVLQVLQATSTARVQISANSYTDLNPSLAITPSSTSSKILVIASYQLSILNAGSNDAYGDVQLLRGASSIIEYEGAIRIRAGIGASSELRLGGQHTMVYLDSPNTTSATTYKFQGKCQTGTRIESVGNPSSSVNVLTLMEIAG